MQTSLERIANKARSNKKHRFQNLFCMLNQELLHNAWSKLNKKSAPGIDGVTYQIYEKSLKSNIHKLVETVKKKRYRAR